MRFDRGGYSGVLALMAGVVGLLFVLGFLRYVSTESSEEKSSSLTEYNTYLNSKYGFSVEYPTSLEVREFPGSKDGAGFRPAGTPEEPVNEVITISVLPKSGDMKNQTLAKYAEVAAISQIQNYQKLNTIEAVKSSGGAIGYKTTWDVLPLTILGSSPSGQTKVSLPITYFDLKDEASTSVVQITLNDMKYENQYTKIIDSYTP